MKPIYLIGGLLAFLFWRHHNDASASGTTRTEEAAPHEGGNFVTDMWDLLGGGGLSSKGFTNAMPGPNADPGGNAAANLGLTPAWDGSIATIK